jgi:hypothetical protein
MVDQLVHDRRLPAAVTALALDQQVPVPAVPGWVADQPAQAGAEHRGHDHGGHRRGRPGQGSTDCRGPRPRSALERVACPDHRRDRQAGCGGRYQHPQRPRPVRAPRRRLTHRWHGHARARAHRGHRVDRAAPEDHSGSRRPLRHHPVSGGTFQQYPSRAARIVNTTEHGQTGGRRPGLFLTKICLARRKVFIAG